MNIVEQLPGTETDDHSVKIMGKQVTKTYIDGRLIFGSDPMAALKNLSATDVLKIKAYDEYENTKTKTNVQRGSHQSAQHRNQKQTHQLMEGTPIG